MLGATQASTSQEAVRVLLEHKLGARGAANLIAPDLACLLPPEDFALDQQEHAAYLAEQGLRHEQRPIPYCGLPYILTRRAFEHIGARFARLFVILEQIIDLYRDDAEVRAFFGLAPRHEYLIRLPVGYRPRIQYCRFDFSLDSHGRPRLYELNTHAPAGVVFSAQLTHTFLRSRCHARLRALGLRHVALPLEAPGTFARRVLASAGRAGFPGAGAQVAVLNSRYLTMNTELDMITEQFRAAGCQAFRAAVEDLTFDGRRLGYAGRPIELVFNKYDDSRGSDAYECAFSRTTAEVRAYLDAYSAGAVFAVNSFPAMYLTELKATLAFLWSPLLQRHLSRDDVALIEEIVPRTRLLGQLDPAALQELEQHQAEHVLKRSLDTRGRSVVIGRSVSATEWRAALAAARAEPPDDGYVVQDIAPAEAVATDVAELEGQPTAFTTLACFLFQGDPVGLVTRSSAEETTNVGRRGFVQPTLVVENS